MIKLSKSLPPAENQKYIKLFKELIDIFSWSYEYLKSYDTNIIQHIIPIKITIFFFKQKLRRINPRLMHLIEKEVKNIYDTKIIILLIFSKWVSNLVPTRKKEWRNQTLH
jgi:hypothetical protein